MLIENNQDYVRKTSIQMKWFEIIEGGGDEAAGSPTNRPNAAETEPTTQQKTASE